MTSRTAFGLTMLLAAAAHAGCGAPSASSSPSIETPTPSATPSAIPAPSGSAEASLGALPLLPPAASIAGVGGSLGSYTWGDGGADSGWLRGSPLLVPRGSHLDVTLDAPVAVAHWSARYAPAGQPDDAGAKALADGLATISFPSPPPGHWTLELHVTFADELGDAAYFWDATVT